MYTLKIGRFVGLILRSQLITILRKKVDFTVSFVALLLFSLFSKLLNFSFQISSTGASPAVKELLLWPRFR